MPCNDKVISFIHIELIDSSDLHRLVYYSNLLTRDLNKVEIHYKAKKRRYRFIYICMEEELAWNL